MKYYLNKMKWLLIAVSIIAVGFLFTWFNLLGNINPGNDTGNQNVITTPGQKIRVDLYVDNGNGKITSYDDTEINEGDTAYSVLFMKMKETGTQVLTKNYEFGMMVESVNGIAASASHFWSYSVNGQPGTVAADKYLLKEGDAVEWKYTKIQ